MPHMATATLEVSSLVSNCSPSFSAPDADALIHGRSTRSTGSPAFANLSNHSSWSACYDRTAGPDRVRRQDSSVQDLHIVFNHDHIPNRAVRTNVDIALDFRGTHVGVWSNVDIVGYSQHEIGHDLDGFAAVGVRDRGEARRRMERTARAHKDISAQVYGRLILGCRFLLTSLGLLCAWSRLWRPHKVAVDDHILLNDTFSGKDDVSRS